MSTAAATAPAEAAAPKAGGKKKLLILIAAALLLVLLAGGAALYLLKQRQLAALEAEDGAGAASTASAHQRDPDAVPVFVPLDSFTVNLADRDTDRYAQISITLELDDPKAEARIKAFMPVVRNNILLVLSQKRAADLMDRAGKEALALAVQRETERALGWEPGAKPSADALRPVRAVHFSNFIIQ